MALNKDFESWYFGEGSVVNGMEDPYDIAEAAWVAKESAHPKLVAALDDIRAVVFGRGDAVAKMGKVKDMITRLVSP